MSKRTYYGNVSDEYKELMIRQAKNEELLSELKKSKIEVRNNRIDLAKVYAPKGRSALRRSLLRMLAVFNF